MLRILEPKLNAFITADARFAPLLSRLLVEPSEPAFETVSSSLPESSILRTAAAESEVDAAEVGAIVKSSSGCVRKLRSAGLPA